jgi:hypothetical protein
VWMTTAFLYSDDNNRLKMQEEEKMSERANENGLLSSHANVDASTKIPGYTT